MCQSWVVGVLALQGPYSTQEMICFNVHWRAIFGMDQYLECSGLLKHCHFSFSWPCLWRSMLTWLSEMDLASLWVFVNPMFFVTHSKRENRSNARAGRRQCHSERILGFPSGGWWPDWNGSGCARSADIVWPHLDMADSLHTVSAFMYFRQLEDWDWLLSQRQALRICHPDGSRKGRRAAC